jgi:type I restriction enzyme S subunit
MPNLNTGILAGVPVVLPPLEEQRAIADTLDALDDKIESNRRVALCARACIDGLTFALRDLPLTALSSLAAVSRDVIDPATLTTGSVEHFSIPAFDVEIMPERTAPSSIRSGKFAILGPRVLVSRLNPGTPRVWYAVPSTGTGLGSTEFLVLDHPMHDSLAQIWLAVTGEPFTHEMQRRATGTSGSHQRVGPADAMAIEVPDTRLTDERVLAEADALLRLAHQARVESQALGALRDALLPELLSGRLRVPEAREQVEAVV